MHQNSDVWKMEAHIPFNSYSPGYLSTMNHNLSANGSENTHKLSSDQRLGHFKEVFKQTMLNQEMIFKDQIRDLHRLYGRQKELMEVYKRSELDRHNLGTGASSSTILSQSSPVCCQQTFNIPCVPPSLHSSHNQLSISAVENVHSPSCFAQGKNIHACSYSPQTEGHSGNSEFFQSKCKRSRNNLDLRLPADVIYIDSEEDELIDDRRTSEPAELSSHPINRIPGIACNGVAKEVFGTNGFNSVSNYASSGASLEKGSVDLNLLYKLEEEIAPTSEGREKNTCGRDLLCNDVSQKTKSYYPGLPSESFQSTQSRHGAEAYSNVILQGTESKQEGWSSYNYKAGKIQSNLYSLPQGFHAANVSPSSSSLHPKFKRAEEPSSFHHSYRDSSSEREVIGVQSFRSHSSPKYDRQSGPTGAFTCTSCQQIPQDYTEMSGSSCIAALRKPIHELARAPEEVQALPCVSKTYVPLSDSCKLATGWTDPAEQRLQLKKDLRSSTKHDGSSFGNAFQLSSKKPVAQPPSITFDNLIKIGEDLLVPELHGVTKNREDSAKDTALNEIDLNLMPPKCSLDATVSQSFQTTGAEKLANVKSSKRAEILDLNVAFDSVLTNVELTAENPVEQSMLKRDVGFGVDIDLNSSISDVGFGVGIDLNTSTNEDEFSSMSSSLATSLLKAPASPENKECSPPRGVSSDGNQVDTPDLMSGLEDPENKECSPPRGESDVNQADKSSPLSLQEDSNEQIETSFELSGQEALQNNGHSQPSESIKVQMETNISSLELEDSESRECSQPMDTDENQTEIPIPLSGHEEYLGEEPLLTAAECSQPMDRDENQTEIPIPLSGHEEYLGEELLSTAAECLVSISSSVFPTCSEVTTYKPSKTSCDSLQWFADLASSVLGSLENELGCGDHGVVLPDGMDYFEAMTLKLPETKVEDCYSCRSNGHKELIVTASMQSQPKKVRSRKGRQRRKNFRSDILPALVSLSRHEVTEDLQIIGTLIEVSVGCSKTRSVRHAAKFGLARGRRRCTISASTVTEKTTKAPLKHIVVESQLDNVGRSLIGWGEVTRRRRGQRKYS